MKKKRENTNKRDKDIHTTRMYQQSLYSGLSSDILENKEKHKHEKRDNGNLYS